MTILSADDTIACLTAAWGRAVAADAAARTEWATVEGAGWSWAPEGALASGGGEWAALAWRRCGPDALRSQGGFAVAVTVSGAAGLAGLSLGPYKDFLVELPSGAAHRLRLEVDAAGGRWAFYVDGALQTRSWWDAGVKTVDDLLSGELCLKAYAAQHVVFSDLALNAHASSCELSVVLTCNRFLQRLRVTLRNWCAQEAPADSFELLVANPASDDGCAGHLAAVARSHPHLGVREVPVDPQLALNKGAMINRAVAASRGRWVWLSDADCLFGPESVALVLEHLRRSRPGLFFGERHHLSEAQTDALLSGRLDGLRDAAALFARAEKRWFDRAPWGYTQIVPRATLQRFPYPEHMNHFAHTDNLFTEQCRRRGLSAEPIPGLRCLHLVHPFAWYGTSAFL